jgi:hypothetical protein
MRKTETVTVTGQSKAEIHLHYMQVKYGRLASTKIGWFSDITRELGVSLDFDPKGEAR